VETVLLLLNSYAVAKSLLSRNLVTALIDVMNIERRVRVQKEGTRPADACELVYMFNWSIGEPTGPSARTVTAIARARARRMHAKRLASRHRAPKTTASRQPAGGPHAARDAFARARRRYQLSEPSVCGWRRGVAGDRTTRD